MKNPNKKFDKQLDTMREEALQYLKYLVYNKFKQNKTLNCFGLAMGVCFWVDLDNEVLYDHEVNDKFVQEFIQEWDDVFKLTGEGIKWFRDGSVITDW